MRLTLHARVVLAAGAAILLAVVVVAVAGSVLRGRLDRRDRGAARPVAPVRAALRAGGGRARGGSSIPARAARTATTRSALQWGGRDRTDSRRRSPAPRAGDRRRGRPLGADAEP